jgi:hypothetical protein
LVGVIVLVDERSHRSRANYREPAAPVSRQRQFARDQHFAGIAHLLAVKTADVHFWYAKSPELFNNLSFRHKAGIRARASVRYWLTFDGWCLCRLNSRKTGERGCTGRFEG